jgi:hypothetical protein
VEEVVVVGVVGLVGEGVAVDAAEVEASRRARDGHDMICKEAMCYKSETGEQGKNDPHILEGRSRCPIHLA